MKDVIKMVLEKTLPDATNFLNFILKFILYFLLFAFVFISITKYPFLRLACIVLSLSVIIIFTIGSIQTKVYNYKRHLDSKKGDK